MLAYCSPNAGFHTWVGLAISNEAHPRAGISWGAPAQSTASKLAFDSCIKDGGSKCKVRMLLYNQCLAFATSPNGMWGAYNNDSRKLAESNAIRKCQESNGTNCAVLLSKCSTDPVRRWRTRRCGAGRLGVDDRRRWRRERDGDETGQEQGAQQGCTSVPISNGHRRTSTESLSHR